METDFDLPGILRDFVGPERAKLLMGGKPGDGLETIHLRLGEPPLYRSVRFRGKLLAEMFTLSPAEGREDLPRIVIIRANCGRRRPLSVDRTGYEVTRERIFLTAWDKNVLRHVAVYDADGKPKLGCYGVYKKLEDVYDKSDDEFCHALVKEAKIVLEAIASRPTHAT